MSEGLGDTGTTFVRASVTFIPTGIQESGNSGVPICDKFIEFSCAK